MLIRQASLLIDDVLRPADIRIKDGRIVEIGDGLPAGSAAAGAEEIIDASGLIALPGVIDPHVHFNDPGYTHREDFLHGSMAALAGGITTVIDMPCTSAPPVTSLAHLLRKLEVIASRAVVDYGLFGGVNGQSFEGDFPRSMEELAPQVLGFKTYFISGMPTFRRLDHHQFFQVLLEAAELDRPVLLHAEDFEYVSGATGAAEAAGSAQPPGAGPAEYYRSRPEIAEVLAVQAAASLAREAAGSLHIVHVGTAEAVDIITPAAASKGSPAAPRITCETAPHYLAFTLKDFVRLGSSLKTTPPVKGPPNREHLWEQLASGAISFVASDHAPCPAKEKRTGSIWTDYAGIPGCCTLLPFLFSEGYLKKRISLQRLVEATSANAAKRYGIHHRKGGLDVGKDADVVLIDPDDGWTVKGEELYSLGKITPFDGMTFRGRIKMTIRRGEIAYADGEGILAEPGSGELLRRNEPERTGGLPGKE